jgi:excisionase family DNA binding protein
MHSVGLGRSTIYRWIDDGRFPGPIEIGPGCVRWREDEVEAWKADRIAASTAARSGELSGGKRNARSG